MKKFICINWMITRVVFLDYCVKVKYSYHKRMEGVIASQHSFAYNITHENILILLRKNGGFCSIVIINTNTFIHECY